MFNTYTEEELNNICTSWGLSMILWQKSDAIREPRTSVRRGWSIRWGLTGSGRSEKYLHIPRLTDSKGISAGRDYVNTHRTCWLPSKESGWCEFNSLLVSKEHSFKKSLPSLTQIAHFPDEHNGLNLFLLFFLFSLLLTFILCCLCLFSCSLFYFSFIYPLLWFSF